MNIIHRCTYPTNPWLLDYIVHQKKGRSATTLHVLKNIAGPYPDGSKLMQVGDGDLLMKAEFTGDSFEKLESSEDEDPWDRTLIMIKDWEMRLILKETKEKSEYMIHIKRFVVWCDERGLSTKNAMVPCESHPLIRENIDRIWEENHTNIESECQNSDSTVNSIPLSILLDQIEKDEQKQKLEEEALIRAIPNAGFLVNVSAEDLEKKFEAENVQDIIIHPEDEEILASIVEWQPGYQAPENSSLQSSKEKAISLLFGNLELKNQPFMISPHSSLLLVKSNQGCQTEEKENPVEQVSQQLGLIIPSNTEGVTSAQQISQQSPVFISNSSEGKGPEETTLAQQVSQQSSEVMSNSNDRCEYEKEPLSRPVSLQLPKVMHSNKRRSPGKVTLAQQSNSETEEEIRLFDLTRISNKDGKCSPLKELEKSNRPDANDLKNSTNIVTGSNKAICISGTISTSQNDNGSTETSFEIQNDNGSTETSFEIPMSGKVASVYNPNKSASEENHCNSFDSILDTSAEKHLPRWNNLDLSSIESETQFNLNVEKEQRNRAELSKKLKLTHASESACNPGSNNPQDQLINQSIKELDKNNLTFKSPRSVSSKLSSLQTNKFNSQKGMDSKVSPVNLQEQFSDFHSSALTKRTNHFSDDLVNNVQPVDLYATCEEIFPKHPACLSLLPSANQLSVQNNLNRIQLNKETMNRIHSFWSLSHDHLWQRRYWKQ